MTESFNSMKNKYIKAKLEYNKGTSSMSDDDFDELENKIRLMFPKELENDDFTQYTDTDVPLECKDNEKLPCAMPSLKKIKTNHELSLWLSKHVPKDTNTCTILPKYDGTSGLWIPEKNKLMTRYNGIDGRDVSIHVPNIKGLVSSEKIKNYIIRGEIMIRKDADAVINSGSNFRNVGSGIINTETTDQRANQLTFFAYEICYPSNFTPEEQMNILEENGFTTIKGINTKIDSLDDNYLFDAFDHIEKDNPHYGFDGVVICPNFSLPNDYKHEIRNGKVVLPENKRAWKVRKNQKRYETIVTSVEWNTKSRGKLIPVINYNLVVMDKAQNTKATGHNAKVISSNFIGPGSKIVVIRANDTIPKLESVLSKANKPDMPSHCEWNWDENKIHIYRKDNSDEENISSIKKSLDALGAENVGPAIIKSLYNNGFDSISKIYSANPKDFLILDRVGDKSAQRIYDGLRKKKNEWTSTNWMVASMCFPELVGKTKINLIFSIESDWKKWNYDILNKKRPKGLTSDTLFMILNCLEDYKEWHQEMEKIVGPVQNIIIDDQQTASSKKIVFTGFRSEEIEKQLIKQGHIIQSSVNKQTNLVIYKNTGKESSSMKKAKELNIKMVESTKFDINDL